MGKPAQFFMIWFHFHILPPSVFTGIYPDYKRYSSFQFNLLFTWTSADAFPNCDLL